MDQKHLNAFNTHYNHFAIYGNLRLSLVEHKEIIAKPGLRQTKFTIHGLVLPRPGVTL